MEINISMIFSRIKTYLTYIIFCTFPIMTIVTYGAGSKLNISLADVFVLLLGLVYLLDIKVFSLKRDFPFVWYFAALVFFTLLSGFINMRSDVNSVGYIGLTSEIFKLVTSGAYAFVAYNAINCEDENNTKIKTIILCWMIGLYVCMIYGLYAHLSYISGHNFFKVTQTLSYHDRFLGTQTDPNAAAFYLCSSFFMAFWAAFCVFKNLKIRIFLSITNIIVFICIILTLSRGGWIGFASGIAFLLIFNIKKIKKLIYASLLIVIAITVLLLADKYLMSGYLQNNIIQRANVFITGGGTFEVRANLMLASLKMGADHLLFGVGRGNYPLNSKEYLIDLGVVWDSYYWAYDNVIPHNTLTGIFAELGIIGVSVFIALFVIMIVIILKNKKYDFYSKSIILALWISIFVQSLALCLENTRVLWILAGLLLKITTPIEPNKNNQIFHQ